MINSCLFVVSLFLSNHDMGMPWVTSGWMIHGENYYYTWLTDENSGYTTYILLSKSKEGTKFRRTTGKCNDGSNLLNVYELKLRNKK